MLTTQVGSRILYYDDLGAGHPLLLIPGLGVKWNVVTKTTYYNNFFRGLS